MFHTKQTGLTSGLMAFQVGTSGFHLGPVSTVHILLAGIGHVDLMNPKTVVIDKYDRLKSSIVCEM